MFCVIGQLVYGGSSNSEPKLVLQEKYAYISVYPKDKTPGVLVKTLYISDGINYRKEYDIIPGKENVMFGCRTNGTRCISDRIKRRYTEDKDYLGIADFNGIKCFKYRIKGIKGYYYTFFDVCQTNYIGISNIFNNSQLVYDEFAVELTDEQWANAYTDTNIWLKTVPEFKRYKWR